MLTFVLMDTTSHEPKLAGVTVTDGGLVDLTVGSFPQEVLAQWLENSSDGLPDEWVLEDNHALAARLVLDTEGPDDILWRIYELWDCPGWELEAWLKG